MKAFDRKFGAEFFSRIPAVPGVYRVYSSAGEIIYVGKAKSLRTRLGQYRNAKRRKKHHKMRAIINEAARIEYEVCPSDLDALVLENRLIQQHKPRLNVAGAFYFLYPMIGIRNESGVCSFCFTTRPELYLDFQFHGAYRSRQITQEAFLALMGLLSLIAQPVFKRARSPMRDSIFAFRRIPQGWVDLLNQFLRGENRAAVEELVLALAESVQARRQKKKVQQNLDSVRIFWEHEVLPLASACKKTAVQLYPVPQKERDALFLRYRHLP